MFPHPTSRKIARLQAFSRKLLLMRLTPAWELQRRRITFQTIVAVATVGRWCQFAASVPSRAPVLAALGQCCHFAAACAVGSAVRSGGGGSVAQIGRSKVSGYAVTPSSPKLLFKSWQATCRTFPLGIVLTSQTRAVLSWDAVTTRIPSALKTAEFTISSCPASVAIERSEGRVP